MRKVYYLILAIVLVAFLSESSIAQMSRKSIKRNNKKISSYRGKKEGFPKENRYNTLGITLNAMNYYGDLSPRPGSSVLISLLQNPPAEFHILTGLVQDMLSWVRLCMEH